MPRRKRTPITENGRPLKDIDWKIVDSMLESCCTGTEIAAFFALTPQTLYDRCVMENGIGFSSYSQQKQSKTLKKLRDKQIEVAHNGNPSLLIWLGKQYLDQRDQPKEENKKQATEAAIISMGEDIKKYVNETLPQAIVSQTDDIIRSIDSSD